jgi:hypothetical protein
VAATNDTGIPLFGRDFFSESVPFSRLGDGSLGGKASGLAQIHQRILPQLDPAQFPQIEVAVPHLCVLTSELFDSFLERNHLWDLASSDEPDDRIALAFQQAELPAEVVGDLRALISKVRSPLAIRSSSLLEDALAHPFAGVYATKMIPNNQPEVDKRFRRLGEAIKFVFASAFFQGAKAYLRTIGRQQSDEKMSVILQEVVGQRHDERFYPCISGVARSFNYYPSGRARPQDGVVNLALGLGKTIVDGGLSWSYSPAHPKAPPPFSSVGDMLNNTQKDFWAVHMGPPPLPDPIRETEYLVQAELEQAEGDGVLGLLASTYVPQSDRCYPGLHPGGPRLLDFAQILVHRRVALNDLLRRLLELSERELGAAVEIEFAVNLDPARRQPARFGFLQVRAMAAPGEQIEISSQDLAGPGVVIASTRALGNGRLAGLRDLVFLKPEAFEASHTRQMAAELAGFNRELLEAGRNCVLIGFGRWGSSDPWLGVPVEWSQISAARVIVEATLPQMQPDLSQGSHFFHNLISFGAFYLAVPPAEAAGIDWDWLDRQALVRETGFVKHVRAAGPLTILADGRSGRGMVRRDAAD